MSHPEQHAPAPAAVQASARLPVLGLVLALLLVLAGGAAVDAWLTERREGPVAQCAAARAVTLVVDPGIEPAVREALRDTATEPLSTGVCAEVELVVEDSAVTAGRFGSDPEQDLPDLWVPDSSIWLPDAAGEVGRGGTRLSSLGSIASSPLVVASSPTVVESLGWGAAAPGWQQALTSGRPLAVADLARSTTGLHAVLAMRSTVTDPAARTAALRQVAVSLSGAADADVPTALSTAAAAGPGAALVPATEQQVFAHNRDGTGTKLVGVYPSDATASLDYPVVRLDVGPHQGPTSEGAVEGVVRLLESRGTAAALTDGFRAPLPGSRPGSAASAPARDGAVRVLPVPDAAEVDALLADVSTLQRPTRALLVLDASISMRAVTSNGQTRAEVARDATKTVVADLDDGAAVGLWFYAVGLGTAPDGSVTDHVPVVDTQPLAAPVDAATQREALGAGLDALPGRLAPGGSGLLDTALASVRAAREAFDPAAANTVVLLTDGTVDDPGGPGLQPVLDALRAETDPQRPVRLVVVGLAPDVDTGELRSLAEAGGGQAYLAEDPQDLPTVLGDALRAP